METQQFYRPLLCEISWCLLPLRVTPVRLVRFDPQRDQTHSRCHFDRERPRDLFNVEMRADSRHLGNLDEWSLMWNPRALTFQSTPRSRSSELWQVTRNGYCILFYFLHSDIEVKCEIFAHVITLRVESIKYLSSARLLVSRCIYVDYSCYQVCAAQTNVRHFGERLFFSR